ncbi:MAG: glycine cleavage system protein GcvH [Euryarchaeota archaeon]|nr:glycine cleavage system protein GcvH [Euryarchaeota archaeon]MDE1835143.1 glycine cleavage system protein GcvH [Euryarchaeota archaeon]MDE1881464.1 glycine cleavage system protein GcvH [Euryarchaeota archaeon]MDE2046208.1 glycine cleavage system protein GcvH [Thermoplasmata archaeon]
MTVQEKLPQDLRYTESHEWVRREGDVATVGITDHAQAELTDVVFVDLPAVGKEGKPKQPIMVLESVKTVADIYCPFEGQISEVNVELKAHPELVNKDPYGKGWLFKLKITGPGQTPLLEAEAYKVHAAKGGH